MQKKLITGIKKKLRDPIWQFIGVFLTFITLLVPFLAAYLLSSPTPQISNRIMISSQTAKDITDFPEPVSKRMHIFIDEKEEHDLRLFIFLIEYKGKAPVRSTDFEMPIRGKIPDNRKLVGVQMSPNVEGPFRFDRENRQLLRDKHPPINFEVEVLDEQTFQIKPLLLNPGEWLGIEIYTAAKNSTSTPTPTNSVEKYEVLSSEIKWSCHVAGVECPGTVNFDVDYNYLGLDRPAFLQVYVMHEGWGVYFILLFSIVNLHLLVLLAKYAGMNKATPIIQIILFSLAIALSIASGEVASDWLFPYMLLAFDQPIYAYMIFWVNISTIVVLAVISVRKERIQEGLMRKR